VENSGYVVMKSTDQLENWLMVDRYLKTMFMVFPPSRICASPSLYDLASMSWGFQFGGGYKKKLRTEIHHISSSSCVLTELITYYLTLQVILL
jgi:hypothetical protein